MLNLRWANVNLDEGFIRLKPAETKNGKARLILLDDETVALLTKLDAFHPTDHYVFQGRKKEGNKWVRSGERIQDASFNKVWNAACARHKIVQSTEDGEVVSHVEPDGTYVGLIPHDLRRSYVRSDNPAQEFPHLSVRKLLGTLTLRCTNSTIKNIRAICGAQRRNVPNICYRQFSCFVQPASDANVRGVSVSADFSAVDVSMMLVAGSSHYLFPTTINNRQAG